MASWLSNRLLPNIRVVKIEGGYRRVANNPLLGEQRLTVRSIGDDRPD
jgi:hypothetical protein